MYEAGLTTWIWWLSGGLLGVGGLLLAYWSLFHNRSRGVRRCPKCWYNMSYTEGMTCSECGRSQKREKRFFKTRRRWCWGFVALLMMLSGLIGTQWPRIEESGWRSLVPTTVLIAALPWLKTSDAPTSNNTPLLSRMPVVASVFKPTEKDFHRILVTRHNKNNLWQWQEDWLINSALKGSSTRIPKSDAWINHYGEFIEHAIEQEYFDTIDKQRQLAEVSIDVKLYLAPKWLRGHAAYGSVKLVNLFENEPLRVFINLEDTLDVADCSFTSGNSVHYFEMSRLLVDLPSGNARRDLKWRVELHDFNSITGLSPEGIIENNMVLNGVEKINIQIVDKVSEYLDPIEDEKLDARFAKSIVSWAVNDPPFLHLKYPELASKVDFILLGDIAVGVDIDILQGDTIIASTHATWHTATIDKHIYFLSFIVEPAEELTILSDIIDSQNKNALKQYSVRFTSNPSLLNKDWILLCDAYWVGKFTVPLVIED